ncbi:hypothetical protein OIU83_22000 [Flavobacterium sp. LS1R49]|uniref:Bacteriocin-type signal sequence-containing protein n=1 Tax=Flavobacterium shii TaxID=2987687 RepID=A0A9X2YX79_9FLAO|nr:hypothetical protein [Flavobacterium shii]MCV9930348.1 hypothetical protein [Flavobacterium shii]
MKTQKISLANIQGKLSRKEMKTVMAGSTGCPSGYFPCYCNGALLGCAQSIGSCYNAC